MTSRYSNNLVKTSVQLSPSTITWLATWKGITQSEAIRLILERAEILEKDLSFLNQLYEQHHNELRNIVVENDLVKPSTADTAICKVLGKLTSNERLGALIEGLSLVARIRLLDITRQRMSLSGGS